ncbi:hypothetical protein BMF94_5003 [Rhodotorula taiwanensis]|uniref:Uncharacterized protein n=1 Tax=Rhodotorula taiwanensis TaxID=741276 RepID=A0A2S5B5D3_9BASI|nr:hypothetical protein BMF94_5003 [Rhodotorula taiwanensis]
MASPVASLDLLDLFPIASTSESQPVTVEGRTLGVVGPFPVSSILHLALNHLRDSIDDDRGISTLSQRARGKQRDSSQDGNDSADGEFDEESFLDRLTREAARATATDRRGYKSVLVLTGDRERLRTSLVDQFDDSLAGEHVGAHDLALLDKIDIRYLPTSAHLSYFLSAAYDETDQNFAASSATRPSRDPSLLERRPSLVILHDPSTHANEPAFIDAGISAYAAIVAQFCATFEKAPLSPLLAIFESTDPRQLAPILPRHLRSGGSKAGQQVADRDALSLCTVLERFCDWVGTVEAISSPESPTDGTSGEHQTSRGFIMSGRPSPRRPMPDQMPTGLEYRVHPADETRNRGSRIEVRT